MSSPPPVTDATSLAVQILDGLLILGAICILAYILLRYGLGRLRGRQAAGGSIYIVDRVDLDARRSLFAVRVGERQAFLIGSSEAGLSRLAELDPGDLPDPGEPAPSAFARLLRRKTDEAEPAGAEGADEG